MRLTLILSVFTVLLSTAFAAPVESPTTAEQSFPAPTTVPSITLPSPTTTSRSIPPQTVEESFPPGQSATTAARAPDITSTAAEPHSFDTRQAPTTLPDNPWAVHCPIPKNYTLTSFRSLSGPAINGTVFLKISYNNTGTFTCPHPTGDRHSYISYYKGVYDMNCDVNGLVLVQTDGFSWVSVEEDFYCSDFKNVGPRPADTMGTFANHTSLSNSLRCELDSNNTKTCVQSVPDVQIPIQIYRGAGFRGTGPMDVNGTELQGCPPMTSSVIVYDTSVCSPTPAPVPVVSSRIS